MCYKYKIDEYFKSLTKPKEIPHIQDIKKTLDHINEQDHKDFYSGSCEWKRSVWNQRRILREKREDREMMREMHREDKRDSEMGRWF